MLDWIKILDDVKFQVRRFVGRSVSLSLAFGPIAIAGCHLPLCPSTLRNPLA